MIRLAVITERVVANDGQGAVNRDLCLEAIARKHELWILAGKCDLAATDGAGVTIETVGAPWIPTQLLRNLAFALRTTFRVAQLRHELDIVHVNGFNSWCRSDVNTAHFVHSAWIADPHYPFRRWWRSPYFAYQYLYTRINARLEKGAFHRSRRIVAVSSQVERDLCNLGIPPAKIVVITNGVDTGLFSPGPAERARFGLPDGVILALFAGDIRTPRKNLETVLRALKAVPRVHLAVAGSISGSPYPNLAADLGISDRVHFLGAVREMPQLMRSADLFVYPSRYETMGMVVLEAMASGLPVITTRTVGSAELVSGGGRVLENPDDESTLSIWIHDLAGDAALRKQMGLAGRARALENSRSAMLQRYFQLYAELVSEGNHR